MNIVKHELFSERDLIERLRKVTMLKSPDTKVYEQAFISLERIATDFMTPPQNYILREELKKVRLLKWSLEKRGINLFELNGFVRITLENLSEPIDVLPPIVEESIEKDGSMNLIINDGMHRVYMARREWLIPQVVFIRGIPKDLPYYAYPAPNGWNGVEERDDLPPGYLKKWHRIENYHALYRNFNSAFVNVGGPREFFRK